MGIIQLQSNFTRGELDPKLDARNELSSYYNGVSRALNVLTLVQGGLRTRPGQEYLGEALGNGRLERFAFSTTQQYLLVFTDLRLQIYKDGVLLPSINGGNNYIVTPYTLDEVRDIDFIQSADVGICTHESHQPRQLVRNSDTDWTFGLIAFSNVPQYDFNDPLSPTPVSAVQRLVFTSYVSGDRFKISLEGILTDDIVFASAGSATAQNIKQALLALSNTGNTGIAVVPTGATQFDITLSGDSANNWELMTVTPVAVKTPASVSVAESITTPGASREEPAWSATRGWPRTATFHQARLWLGGSLSLPQTLWASRVADFFNFDAGRGRDDESIAATLDTDQVNAIQGVYSNRTLQVFTTGNEFFVPQQSSEPITPENIQVLPQTNYGSKRIRPVTIDGLTLYVQRTGKNLRQFVFVDVNQAYSSTSVSILASHLVRNPTEVVVAQGTSTSDSNYAYIVNDDGAMTVLNSLVSEDIVAFTEWTSGLIRSASVVSDRLYLLVERVIDGNTVYYIEAEDNSLNMDSALVVATAGSDVVTGLSHLEGELVSIKADGAVLASRVVVGGEVTMERVADIVEVGLPWTPIIETMPINVALEIGPNAPFPKRIVRALVNLYESLGVIVNGQRIADKTIGVDQFSVPEPSTRLEEIYLLGWSVDAKLTVTRDTPVPFTILSLGAEVSV